jgi:hypothetical protein
LGDSAAIIRAGQQLRALLDSEDEKYGPDHDSTWKRIRHTSRLWILSVEPVHLAKLGRFDDAVELIRKRKDTFFVSGEFADQPRFRSAAKDYADAISIFRESEEFSKARFDAAADEMLDWLELAVESGQLKSAKYLARNTWDLFRENQRFESVLKDLQKD